MLGMAVASVDAQSSWTITLNVAEADGLNRDLTFGVDPTGTAGVDAALNEIVQPPLPPAGSYDVRFSDNGGLLIDIREGANGTAQTLPLTFQRAAGGAITLTWDQSEVAEATTAAKIQDPFGGLLGIDVDMRTENSVSIANAAIASAVMTFTSTDDFSFPLRPNAEVLAFSTVPTEATSTVPFTVAVNATDNSDVVQAGASVTISQATGAGSISASGLTQITDAYAISSVGVFGFTGDLGKRATLTMRYTTDQLGTSAPAKFGIFRQTGDQWLRLGGTNDPGSQLVLLAVESLGTFAVFEDRSILVGGLAVHELDCQPRAFAPRGGRLRGETDISFTLTGPADVTVRVYNVSGRLERVIAREQAMAPGRVTLQWNGQNENSELVASGLYIVAVDAGGEHREKIVAVMQ